MIIRFLLEQVATMVIGIFALIQQAFPDLQILGSDMMGIITQIMSISNQALNFCHFIVGDSIVIILGLLPPLLIAKYLVLPVITVIKGLIPFFNIK